MFDRIAHILRPTAAVLMLCFAMVWGASSVHTHHDDLRHDVVVAAATGDHQDGAGDCSLCHVTKQQILLTSTVVLVHLATVDDVQYDPVDPHRPISIARTLSDRAPPEQRLD